VGLIPGPLFALRWIVGILPASTMEVELVKGLSRVLCAVDIDEPGRAAFAQALALARAHDARMSIVYAVPLSKPFNTGATERVDYLLELRAAAEAAGVEVRVDVQQGEAAEIILLHARARRPDLIVVSAAHGSGADGLGVGSVVENVLRGASCPTLVVRRNREFPPSPFRNVLCAVDFSLASDAAIERALSLAPGRERRLALLHVVHGSEGGSRSRSMRMHGGEHYRHIIGAALQRLQRLIPLKRQGTVFARVAVGTVASEILRVARASQTDMIVVGTQSRTRVGRRMFGVIGQLLKEAPCPVLAVPVRAAVIQERDGLRPAA
jgi:nucleotide-binding universal stress UspA family protein